MELTSLNDDFSNKNETDLLTTVRKKNNFDQFLKLIENSPIQPEEHKIKNFIEENLGPDNHYLFIYLIIAYFKKISFISFIKENILKKVIFDKTPFDNYEENVFFEKDYPKICTYALNQAIEINEKNILLHIIKNEKKISGSILLKLVMNPNVKIIKYLLENKIYVYDYIGSTSSNLMNNLYNVEELFKSFAPSTKKNNLVHPPQEIKTKHLFYYLYKNKDIPRCKKENIFKKLIKIVGFNSSELVITMIKMRDQDIFE